MDEFKINKPRGATRRKKVVGRGAGSGHGSTAGRGSKGQNSRSGKGTRIGFEGGQMPLFRRVARRGFSNHPFKIRYTTVAVGVLEAFSDGDTVSRQTLIAKKIVRSRAGLIKILGNGTLSRKLVVDVDKVTAGAWKIIEAAGGQIVGKAAAAPPRPTERPAAAAVPAEGAPGTEEQPAGGEVKAVGTGTAGPGRAKKPTAPPPEAGESEEQ